MVKGYKKRYAKQKGQTRPVKIPAKARYNAFTQKYDRLINRIVTPVELTLAFDPKDNPGGKVPFPVIKKTALWDTGSTGCVLTEETVKEMNLTPVGTTILNHADGATQSNTYLVNIHLPNRVGFAGMLVSECKNITGDFGAIIGMDIIAKGDFAITNKNKKTCVSFRVPSMQSIDYVDQHKKLTRRK